MDTMVITHQGDTYFKIQSGSFTILIDPINARSFKGTNIVLNTRTPALLEAPEGEEGLCWIENAGEYEIGGVRVEGWGAGHEKTWTYNAYRIKLEDIEVGVVGPIAGTPYPEVIEGLRNVDILIVPGGGGALLSAKDAVRLVREIEPGVVIPYAGKGEPKEFFAELGQAPPPEEKLVIKKKEITKSKIQGVWLKT
ncbi:MAG: MBL fold metallo-hydrolase [bacterium]|nr:MBL fold metallo-hydrolase [bacterium]